MNKIQIAAALLSSLIISGIGSHAAVAQEILKFDKMAGKWTGFGWAHYGIDRKERVRCKAVITSESEGQMGTLDFSCDSTELNMSAYVFDLVIADRSLNGIWSMRSHEVDGRLSGEMGVNGFKARLQPAGQPVDGYGADLTTTLTDKCNASMDVKIDSPIDLNAIELKARRC